MERACAKQFFKQFRKNILPNLDMPIQLPKLLDIGMKTAPQKFLLVVPNVMQQTDLLILLPTVK